MKFLRAYLIIAVIAAAVTSCQKEPDDSILTPPTVTCQLTRAEALDGNGGVDDTASYVYTSDKITRINYTDYYNTIEYAGSKVSKRNYFQTGTTTQIAYDAVTYNGDGTISKVQTFFTSPTVPAGILFGSFEFTYTGGKLSKYIERYDTTFSGATPVTLYDYSYTYTGNNVTRVILKDIEANETDTLDYSYDTKANYYSKNPAALFVDMIFNPIDGQLFPFYLSANNPIKLSQSGSNFAVTYTLDDKNNLKELLVDGSAIVRYTYKCN